MRMLDLNLDRYEHYPEMLRFLINFLSDWLLLHILEDDRKISVKRNAEFHNEPVILNGTAEYDGF
jgi:hemerythrin